TSFPLPEKQSSCHIQADATPRGTYALRSPCLFCQIDARSGVKTASAAGVEPAKRTPGRRFLKFFPYGLTPPPGMPIRTSGKFLIGRTTDTNSRLSKVEHRALTRLIPNLTGDSHETWSV